MPLVRVGSTQVFVELVVPDVVLGLLFGDGDGLGGAVGVGVGVA